MKGCFSEDILLKKNLQKKNMEKYRGQVINHCKKNYDTICKMFIGKLNTHASENKLNQIQTNYCKVKSVKCRFWHSVEL